MREVTSIELKTLDEKLRIKLSRIDISESVEAVEVVRATSG